MNEHQLDLLARALFRECSLNAPAWREIGVDPNGPSNVCRARGYNRWRRSIPGATVYDANLRAIRSAERHLNEMGCHTTSIRSPKPGCVSVQVANAGTVRLCARVPEDTAFKILVLGFAPNIG